ncbi:hypothetical protein LSTR_LSTR001353 [Laodelphax striatellus]|uniref:Homeobox domain-containing protein n=1 Tax=Laodelphax striatellus TaxID=195883 RepID=A0A482XEY4_LAOST|nr:hypothetical protein LSTR_LSTR001353 [Laodelphax striatellus]
MRAMDSTTTSMVENTDHHFMVVNKINHNNNVSVSPLLKEQPALNTWHPHVYASPPKAPTPHLIADILGWTSSTTTLPPRDVPTTPSSGVDEPLNLTTRSRSPGFREPPPNAGGVVVPPPINGHITTPPPKAVASHRRNSTSSTTSNSSNAAPGVTHSPKESKKRSKPSKDPAPASASPSAAASPPPGAVKASLEAAGSPVDSSDDGDRKRKKARTTFTGRQIFELERQFEVKKYLSSSERADMAKLLGVTETQPSTLAKRSIALFELEHKHTCVQIRRSCNTSVVCARVRAALSDYLSMRFQKAGFLLLPGLRFWNGVTFGILFVGA